MKCNYRGYLCVMSTLLLFVTANAADPELKTEEDKIVYFLGIALSKNVSNLSLSDKEVELVFSGMRDSLEGNAISLEEATYGPMLNALIEERMQAGIENETAASATYVETMAAEDGAITTESGVIILELVAGDGPSPSSDSVVKAHYHGTLRDGSVFDSSVDRGQPFTSSLNNVIPCWKEAIPMMKEGGKSKIVCPAELAYGSRGAGKVPAGAALTFEVELIEVVN